MKTIESNIFNEIIIKNSRFITDIYKINNTNEINNILKIVKNKYKDATHYCYAYIIDNISKSSDDGEPGGTAGIPILQVLQKNDLNYVLAIVTRYFGGIKLGAGGLVRAYTKSITSALDKGNIITLVKGYNITIEFDYNYTKDIDYLLKNINILNKEFDQKVRYNFEIDDIILNNLINNTNIKIIDKEDKYIVK